MNQDFDFDTWFDLFFDKCRSLGYTGLIDRETFKEDYEEGESPEDAAQTFVDEIT